MSNGTVLVEIPESVFNEALTAHFIMLNGSYGSIDVRCTQVERIEKLLVDLFGNIVRLLQL